MAGGAGAAGTFAGFDTRCSYSFFVSRNTVTKIHMNPTKSRNWKDSFSQMTMITVADTGSMLACMLAFTGPISLMPSRYMVKVITVPRITIARNAAMHLGSCTIGAFHD